MRIQEIGGAGSRSYYAEDFLPTNFAERLFHLMAYNGDFSFLHRHEIGYRGKPLPRDKRFESERYQDGSHAWYRYPGTPPQTTNQWTPAVRRLRDMLSCIDDVISPSQRDGQSLNQYNTHVVVNRYRLPTDKINFHQDKTESFAPGSSIMTISLGAERTMLLAKQVVVEGKVTYEVVDRLRLKAGSLVILSSKTNEELFHCIEPEASTRCRLSLTFRDIQTRARGVGAARTYHTRIRDDAPPQYRRRKNLTKVPMCWQSSLPIGAAEKLALVNEAQRNGQALWEQLAQEPGVSSGPLVDGMAATSSSSSVPVLASTVSSASSAQAQPKRRKV